MKKLLTVLAAALAVMPLCAQPSGRELFNDGWTFTKDGESRVLDLPHDWGVEGEFTQEYPGETGKLPWWGRASYRKTLTLNADDVQKIIRLEVDGAMSGAELWVNGEKVAGHPYGYASWAAEISPYIHEGSNEIEITLDNPENSSRWYPGGGIYRNVWLVKSAPVSVAHWGTYITCELLGGDALVTVQTTLRVSTPGSVTVHTQIPGAFSAPVTVQAYDGITVSEYFIMRDAELWRPEAPFMYVATTTVKSAGGVEDQYKTPFGIRSAQWLPDGFYLNGEKTFLKGVCLHHDAGALGAVWNHDAWERRLMKLKEMGCNAIRCTHNPPAPELLDMCDSMGFLVIDEFTDTWTWPKKENGYARLFNDWAEDDLVAMIHRDRNHPCIIAWSIGNECGEQGDASRWWVPQMLTDICHREDPTRPSTAGNDNPWAASQDYAGTIDVYGFNYKPHLYAQFRDTHPRQPFYGSETSSCISTRGYYRFPVSDVKSEGWENGAPFQVSSYDLYAPAWASCPDYEWAYEDQVPECAGEFVWTGYDYLGEPTPYNLDLSILTNFHTEEEKAAAIAQFESWGQKVSMEPLPSRSSYFGIMDLAGLPKDRFWLYQSRWCPDVPVAHIVPHWTWPDRKGQVTPVHVYTNGDEAELFLNGKSLGRKAREGYRVRWDDVVYAPGTLKVICYKNGSMWAASEVRTAGKARKIALSTDYWGSDLVYVTARIVDSNGTLVPDASNLIKFTVKGQAEIIATDAGDPTSHRSFRLQEIPAFNGMATVVIRRNGIKNFTLTAESKGLKKAGF